MKWLDEISEFQILVLLIVLFFGSQWFFTATDSCSAFSNDGTCNSDLKHK